MTSKHLVDPDLAGMLDQLPAFELTREQLPAIRTGLLAMLAAGGPADERAVSSEQWIAGPAGAPEVHVFLYRPAAAQNEVLPAVLHVHAGGYVMGAPSIADARNRYLAHTVGCTIASVQYRLAPENQFPAALEDARAALLWLHRNAATLKVDPARIAIAGDSAGGGLAASLAQWMLDTREVPVVLQLLTYPMLDNRTGRALDPGPHSGAYVWTRESNRFGWDALLGEGHSIDESRPYAVPALRGDLSGLAPAFIAVGAIDLFADEDIDYAKRLVHAGVPTELHVYPGAFHGFDSAPDAWASRDYTAAYTAALRRALHPAKSEP